MKLPASFQPRRNNRDGFPPETTEQPDKILQTMAFKTLNTGQQTVVPGGQTRAPEGPPLPGKGTTPSLEGPTTFGEEAKSGEARAARVGMPACQRGRDGDRAPRSAEVSLEYCQVGSVCSCPGAREEPAEGLRARRPRRPGSMPRLASLAGEPQKSQGTG